LLSRGLTDWVRLDNAQSAGGLTDAGAAHRPAAGLVTLVIDSTDLKVYGGVLHGGRRGKGAPIPS
jgi:hypothetical protein